MYIINKTEKSGTCIKIQKGFVLMTPKIRDIRTIATSPTGINLLVVKVETSEPGLYGIGCATCSYRAATIANLVETYIKPLLIGREVNAITEIWQLLHQNAYWRSGPIENNAISGIDMALWDIKGKMAGMPLYELFGGKVRAAVPVYCHTSGADFAELKDHVDRMREAGYRYIRCQSGFYGGGEYGEAPAGTPEGALPGVYLEPRKYMNETVELFEKLRVTYGEDLELLHDVHERIHPTQAREFCHRMDPYHLFFLEDVVSPEQVDWLREIHNFCTTPLSHGELAVNDHEWRRPVMERSIDFVRAHISDLGGVTPAMRMAGFAAEFGVRTCWHCPPDLTPIAAACNIHIDLAIPNFGLQEWTAAASYSTLQQSTEEIDEAQAEEALAEVFSGAPEYHGDGFVYIGDKPGHGVDIDEKAAAKYPCTYGVTTWTQTRNPDGSLQTP